jgi:hypothetical protein
MRTHDVFEFVCLCGYLVQSEERLTTCPKCGRLIQLDWGEHAKQSTASWHAACYAMLLRSRGIDREEVRRKVLERFIDYPEVVSQLERRSKRYAFGD